MSGYLKNDAAMKLGRGVVKASCKENGQLFGTRSSRFTTPAQGEEQSLKFVRKRVRMPKL
jgi:ribosomal protein L9